MGRGTQTNADPSATGVPDGGGLVDLLSLERIDTDLWRGSCHEGAPLRAFGGQVAAQALTAAGRSVPPNRTVHSLHGYFLRAGDTHQPIVYLVERLRDGRSYLSRRVTAVQNGEVVFALSASFKAAEESPDRQGPMPRTGAPETAPGLGADPERQRKSAFHRVLDIRRAEVPREQTVPGETRQRFWIRAAVPLPDDPLLHACALAYASDLWLAPTAALAEEPPELIRDGRSELFLTSLDHAVWYHRPFRADQWMMFAQRSPSAGDGRGLVLADVWDRDGRLLASVVQETVLRRRRRAGPEA